MKRALVTVAACGTAAIMAVAAQNRGFDGRGPIGRLAATLDADHDGTISGAEMRVAPKALESLDANGDGRLTADELRPAFAPDGRGDGQPPFGGRRGRGDQGGERGGAPAASPDDLTDTLMAFDRNSDGRLDRGEVPERFQGLFDRSDANKDGALTRDELKQSATATMQDDTGRGGRESGRGRGGPMAEPLMQALDSDRDGSLSQAEMAAAAHALEPLDANRDGQLSPDEFRPAPGRGRGGREGGRR